MSRAGFAVLAGLVLISACGTTSTANQTTITTSTELARIVVHDGQPVLDAIAHHEDCNRENFNCPVSPEYDWISRYQTIADRTQTLTNSLRATKPSKDTSRLVDQTVLAGEQITAAWKAVQPCLANHAALITTADCGTKDQRFNDAFLAMVPALAAWSDITGPALVIPRLAT